MDSITIDELANFCKRKGFVFRSSEIYNGFAGFWDYGPLGVELFNNIKQDFWNFFVHQKDNIVGIDSSIISHPKTWKASGHLTNFTDVAVVCKKCKRATKIDKSEIEKAVCDNCGGSFNVLGSFNLMFKTNVGSLDNESSTAYLRPETAQGMFMDFKLVQETSRKQLPFGILQFGKTFRNEIAPREFLFRCREFTIAEFEFFIHPDEKKCNLFDTEHKKIKIRLLDAQTQEKGKNSLMEITINDLVKEGKLDEWHAYWLAEQVIWFTKLGLNSKIKIREHIKSELSHYSSATFDFDFEYPFGSEEIAGNANRGQFDLNQHIKESGEKLDFFDEETKKRVVPRVIEPTFGIDRIFLALLCNAYTYDKKRENVVLKLPAHLAPIKASVLPIVKNDKMIDSAQSIVKELRKKWNINYDESGSLGRRYSRSDESGVPICITVDEQTLKDGTVTARWRDNAEQIRIKLNQLSELIYSVIDKKDFFSFGKTVDTRKKK